MGSGWHGATFCSPRPASSFLHSLHAADSSNAPQPTEHRTRMETDGKEAAMEDVSEIPAAAAAASPAEAERQEIPAATAQTGELQHEQ